MKQIAESISAANFPRASNLIKMYLRKNISKNIFLFPEPEHVKTVHGTRVGIRYFVNRIESVRFNWVSDASMDSSKNLESIDYWDGTRHDKKPSYHMAFDVSQSLVKALPLAVEFIKNPIIGNVVWMEEASLVESAIANIEPDFRVINEAGPRGGNVLPTIQNVVRGFKEGRQVKDMRYDASLGTGPRKVIETIREIYPSMFEKQGLAVVFTSKHNAAKIDVNKVAHAMGGIGATTTAGTAETILASREVETMEENLPRLCFEEQLSDLRRAMVLLMNNATQSMYLAGRGGVGKTQTVEDELAKRGLTDGEGYFKITGSASTAGIYRILYKHRKDILLFDDSDGALADTDSRNLFKAASDTKKIRKISWMKAGKNYVDPDDMDEDDDSSDPDVLPRYFDFTGKIIFISNLKLDKLDPDGALRTRGYVISIDPSDTEVYAYMAKIVGNIKLDVDYVLSIKQRQEVIDVLRSRKLKEGGVNLRQLVRGLNTMAGILRDGGSDWHNMVLRYA